MDRTPDNSSLLGIVTTASIIVLLLVVFFSFVAKDEREREAQNSRKKLWMVECQQDYKTYECEYIWSQMKRGY